MSSATKPGDRSPIHSAITRPAVLASSTSVTRVCTLVPAIRNALPSTRATTISCVKSPSIKGDSISPGKTSRKNSRTPETSPCEIAALPTGTEKKNWHRNRDTTVNSVLYRRKRATIRLPNLPVTEMLPTPQTVVRTDRNMTGADTALSTRMKASWSGVRTVFVIRSLRSAVKARSRRMPRNAPASVHRSSVTPGFR